MPKGTPYAVEVKGGKELSGLNLPNGVAAGRQSPRGGGLYPYSSNMGRGTGAIGVVVATPVVDCRRDGTGPADREGDSPRPDVRRHRR
jgi:hypothetical protein